MSQDDYARSAARVASAQLAEASGFDAVQTSSLDVLSDLLLRYIAQLGTASHAYAELANRTDANPLDVVSGRPDCAMPSARPGRPLRSAGLTPPAATAARCRCKRSPTWAFRCQSCQSLPRRRGRCPLRRT